MLNRRQFGIGLAAAGAVAALPRIASAKASELRILTWEGYAEPDWVKPFEAANGVKCQIVYIGSVDEMFAKVQGSKGADYDVIAFDTPPSPAISRTS
jgi:putative spermidine/putrescine transport system substrate-binding protein/spermidine/putrescine transport system substrate-binding protein